MGFHGGPRRGGTRSLESNYTTPGRNGQSLLLPNLRRRLRRTRSWRRGREQSLLLWGRTRRRRLPLPLPLPARRRRAGCEAPLSRGRGRARARCPRGATRGSAARGAARTPAGGAAGLGGEGRRGEGKGAAPGARPGGAGAGPAGPWPGASRPVGASGGRGQRGRRRRRRRGAAARPPPGAVCAHGPRSRPPAPAPRPPLHTHGRIAPCAAHPALPVLPARPGGTRASRSPAVSPRAPRWLRSAALPARPGWARPCLSCPPASRGRGAGGDGQEDAPEPRLLLFLPAVRAVKRARRR